MTFPGRSSVFRADFRAVLPFFGRQMQPPSITVLYWSFFGRSRFRSLTYFGILVQDTAGAESRRPEDKRP